ncbi:MAG: RsmD family RNA methyltransferase [Candidatus Caldarchaeum sp.]|nr:RsmD family RNA methyltransferase [Candidatus Caldarchaeum sp.]MDW8435014.1 RsmD family RNA methyltransferase [Candidatus Caldarchaeum sp.]
MKTFFLLSGENPALSAAELTHLLSVFGQARSVTLVDERIAVSDVEASEAREVVYRAAYAKLAALLLGKGVSVDDLVFEPGWEETVQRFGSFDVLVYELGGADVDSVSVEKRIAAQVLEKVKGVRVDLSNPDVSFVVLVSEKVCVAGLALALKPKKFFADRKAGLRPFKIPSALQPKLARCLVNLAVNTKDSRVLDPFAGSGAVVIEAGLMGHEAFGVEVKTWVANGMRLNTCSYAPSKTHVIQGDAKRLPFTKAFDSVATDPPYGRSATLGGMPFKKLLKQFCTSVVSVLDEKARMAITVPKQLFPDLLEECGVFKLVEHYDLYVHKSLTRRVSVMVLD